MANRPAKTIKFPGLEHTYTFLQDDTTLSVAGEAADAKSTGDALAAVQSRIDGVQTQVDGVQAGQYPDMGAGQLLSESGTVNPTPYTYRENTSGSDRVTISQITGGTVAFNQLIRNGNFDTTANWSPTNGNGFAVSGNVASIKQNEEQTFVQVRQGSSGDAVPAFPANHVYLSMVTMKVVGTEGHLPTFLRLDRGSTATTIATLNNPQNDTWYTLAGFRKSENDERIFVWRMNLPAENWDANTTLYAKNAMSFDLTKMFGSAVADYIYNLETATAGAGVALFHTMFPKSYYPYNAGELLSVQTSGRKSGGHTYPLDGTLTLRGIPVLTDGIPAFDGDKYTPDGTVTRLYGVVDLGTLSWSIYQSTDGAFRAVISDCRKAKINDAPDFICGSAKYTPINSTNSAGVLAADDKTIVHPHDNTSIVIKDSAYGSDASALAASLSGVYLVYELATPATETAAPYQSVQIAGSTEEFLPPETDTRPAAVPVGSQSLYQTNLREGLETLLDTDLAHAESIAPVHGATASTNIASGELLMQDGKLYKATQAIVAGAEIVPGTNATQTSVADVFKPTVYQLTPQGTGVTLDTTVSNIKVFPVYGLAVLTVKFTVTSSITNYLAFASCTDVRPNMGLGSDDGISVVVANATATKRITLALRPNGWMRVYPADTADNDGTYYATVVYPV